MKLTFKVRLRKQSTSAHYLSSHDKRLYSDYFMNRYERLSETSTELTLSRRSRCEMKRRGFYSGISILRLEVLCSDERITPRNVNFKRSLKL